MQLLLITNLYPPQELGGYGRCMADFAWGFWEYEPDYFVYLPDFDWALGAIRTDPRFEECYVPTAQLPGPREIDFTIFKNGCVDSQ